ncbi:Pre-rRNA-processing protein TSR2-domain-containing protein [Thamnocephalis sphaerospora]|uniref:Pre-rRNA-processing protein TSR2-domain-containing protein n=1 Tax=Thamnocephalis sphaerospora TaxID=78915 RepID=A0A4P9XUT1_9FUNG|nr:Pre-rRNA-processing protein TSR2-domain-containing protein [Thamnocephalis sphaerospora]|eukprot:RKP09341.1 Pre-rRNA-processing protein TSR2-domain-containing protein [Thamnocephalis sphaerospora]
MSSSSSSSAAPPAQHPNQIAFTEGVALTLKQWTALRLAITNDWGNDGLGDEKRDWMCEVLVGYFGQRGKRVEPEDVEDILLQIMQDEFNTQLEDGSAFEIGKQLVKMFTEVTHGNHTAVHQLRASAEQRTLQQTDVAASSMRQGEESDSDSEDEEHDGDAAQH